MGYLSFSKNKYMIAKLTFKNGSEYIASERNHNDNILKSFNIHESEARTTTNLLGVVNSNNCSLSIIDKSGKLLQSNGSSEFNGLLGSGVKVELFELEENGVGQVAKSTKQGEYYTDSWNNAMIGYDSNITSLYCWDKLSYIGQKELPIINLSSVSIKSLIKNLFSALGLTEQRDYVIDNSLDLNVLYSVTKGVKVKDTLNEIAQALIARITCDRNGIIHIKPAFDNNSGIKGVLAEKSGSDFNIKNNTDTGNYTYVKVGYANLNISNDSTNLGYIDNVVIPGNDSKIVSDIDIPKNTKVIDAVQCRCDWDDNDIAISGIKYDRTQNGLSVTITNNNAKSVTADITIKGKSITTSNAFTYDSTNDKSGNLFETNNIYIQSESAAKTFADNIKAYLDKIKNRFAITAYINMDIKCGDCIEIESNSSNIQGTYYINGLDISADRRTIIDAIKLN